MDYTITYDSVKSIMYLFHEDEIMEKLRQKAERHAQKTNIPSAKVTWNETWRNDKDGRLVIEITCEFKSTDETKRKGCVT